MNSITSKIIPINRSHIDTDLIIPAEFMRSISKKGYGQHLFARLRASDETFPLNDAKYQGAKILVSGENFGCGSSREHAAWALADWGIQAIIAASFADIFRQNAMNNRIIPIVLPHKVIEMIFLQEAQASSYEITINLSHQSVMIPTGEMFYFSIDPYKKECLLQGMDDFDYLLSKLPQIEAFERNYQSFRKIDTHAAYRRIHKEGKS